MLGTVVLGSLFLGACSNETGNDNIILELEQVENGMLVVEHVIDEDHNENCELGSMHRYFESRGKAFDCTQYNK